MIRTGPLQQQLRALVIERRDCQAALAETRLRVLDAEQAGMDASDLRRQAQALEDRDREIEYAQRQVSVAIADGETTILGAG